MATNNAVNVGLAGSTGTVSFVGSTSPTIVTPSIGQINDASGNKVLTLTKNGGGAAANFLTFEGSQAGSPVVIMADGSDTDVTIQTNARGAGAFSWFTTLSTAAIVYNTGTANQHVTNFTFANTSANRTVTWPDEAGAVALSTSGTWTPTDQSGAGLSFTNPTGSYVSMGGVVIASCSLTYPATADASAAVIGGLPFASSATVSKQGGTVQYTTVATLARTTTTAGSQNASFWTATGGAVINSALSGSLLYLQYIYIL